MNFPGLVDFSVAKVGDRVVDARFGIGVIVDIIDIVREPIHVKFNIGVTSTYTISGRFKESDIWPTLYYADDDGNPLAARPKQWIQKQISVIVWKNTNGRWSAVEPNEAEATNGTLSFCIREGE